MPCASPLSFESAILAVADHASEFGAGYTALRAHSQAYGHKLQGSEGSFQRQRAADNCELACLAGDLFIH